MLGLIEKTKLSFNNNALENEKDKKQEEFIFLRSLPSKFKFHFSPLLEPTFSHNPKLTSLAQLRSFL